MGKTGKEEGTNEEIKRKGEGNRKGGNREGKGKHKEGRKRKDRERKEGKRMEWKGKRGRTRDITETGGSPQI